MKRDWYIVAEAFFFCAPFVIIANVPIIFVSILSIWMS